MERFAPRSMDDSIAGNRMRLMFDHGQDASISRKVIGSVRSVTDDGRGAAYEAELLDYVAHLREYSSRQCRHLRYSILRELQESYCDPQTLHQFRWRVTGGPLAQQVALRYLQISVLISVICIARPVWLRFWFVLSV